MKVCFLGHNLKHDNGAGVFATHIVDGIKSKGFEVIALTTEGGSGKSYERALLSKGRLKLLGKFFAIRKILKSADIIHALDLHPYGMIAAIFSFGLRKKIIITAIGSGSIIPLHNTLYLFSKWCFKRAAEVTAISRFTKEEVKKRIPKLKISVINPGIDTKIWHADSGKKAPDISLPRKYILSVGSLRARKGYRYSIDAFAKIAPEFPDLGYVIVGKRYSDKGFNRIRSFIDERGLANRVHILESVDDIDDLQYIYKHAELFILLSQPDGHDVEGFGIAFLEAASLGLPVVGTKGSGIEDAVNEGKNGFLVPVRDSEAAAEAVKSILSDSPLRSRMSGESNIFAQAHDWENVLERYGDLYIRINSVDKNA